MSITVLLGNSPDINSIGPFVANSFYWNPKNAAATPDVPTMAQATGAYLTKSGDDSSPALMQAANTGTVYDPSTVTFSKPDPSTGNDVPYLVITLSNTMVASYSTSGSGSGSSGGYPTESVGLNFTSFALNYTVAGS